MLLVTLVIEFVIVVDIAYIIMIPNIVLVVTGRSTEPAFLISDYYY